MVGARLARLDRPPRRSRAGGSAFRGGGAEREEEQRGWHSPLRANFARKLRWGPAGASIWRVGCANDHSPGCVRGVYDPRMRLRWSRPMAGGPREEAGNEEEFRCDWEGTRAKTSLGGPRRDRELLRAPLARGLASEPPERRPCPAGRVQARPASFALEASRFPGCKRRIVHAKERSREARSPSTPSVSRGSGQRHRARTQQLQAHVASPRGARAANIPPRASVHLVNVHAKERSRKALSGSTRSGERRHA